MTGHEVAIRLNVATIERLKEVAALADMQFLAAAIIHGSWIRTYFLGSDGVYGKDIPLSGRDPNRDLFQTIASFNITHRGLTNTGDYYLEVPHRPN